MVWPTEWLGVGAVLPTPYPWKTCYKHYFLLHWAFWTANVQFRRLALNTWDFNTIRRCVGTAACAQQRCTSCKRVGVEVHLHAVFISAWNGGEWTVSSFCRLSGAGAEEKKYLFLTGIKCKNQSTCTSMQISNAMKPLLKHDSMHIDLTAGVG